MDAIPAEPELPAEFAAALHAYEVYLSRERGRSAHTVRAYLADLTQLLVSAAGQGRSALDRLDLEVLGGWLAAMTEAGLAHSTVARRASSVRGFTAWAVRTGRLATDPANRLASPRRSRRLPSVLRADQPAAVLDVAARRADDADPTHIRDRAALELLYATGVRVRELVGLDVDDVNLGRRVVTVPGKAARERVVPFGIPVERALRVYLSTARPRLVAAHSGSALFLGRRGGRLDQRQVRALVHDLLALAETGINAGPRLLRPSVATRLREGGAGPRTVQEVSGHASLATTQVYTHVSPDWLRPSYEQAHPRA